MRLSSWKQLVDRIFSKHLSLRRASSRRRRRGGAAISVVAAEIASAEQLEDRRVCSAEMAASAYVFDGNQHIFFRSEDGHIQERWFNGSWQTNDLTVAAGMPVSAVGSPVGYVTNGEQHVVYRGMDDRIHELRWRSSQAAEGWKHTDVTADAGASANVVSGLTAYVGTNGTQHLIYRGSDSRIHELYRQAGKGWRHSDLTRDSGAAANVASDPASYLDGTTQNIVYRGNDGHIYLLSGGTSWRSIDLSAAAQTPLADSAPTGYMHGGIQHVVFRATDNQLIEIWGRPGGWNSTNLTTASGQPANATSDPSGYSNGVGQHVVYRGSDGHVHELWWAGSVWNHNDLTSSVSGATAAASAPFGTANGETQMIAYQAVDRRVHQLRWTNSGGWSDTALSAPEFLVDSTMAVDQVTRMRKDTFYPQYYLSQNADLQSAFGAANYAAATQHWYDFGMREGRAPNPHFSARQYLALYSDLNAAFGTNNVLAAQHWLTYGIAEQRHGVTPGIVVTPANSLATTESGGTASLTVVLKDQPAANELLSKVVDEVN